MSTNTNTDTNAVTRTDTSARVMISETKSGIVQYSFGAVPESRSRDPELAKERAERSGMDQYDDKDTSEQKELVFDVTLDAEGGANATGLVFEKGPDGLLLVAKIRPGGTAAGVVKPGDVLLGCSLLVNVEDDDGEFTPELRWHDATANGPEHTLSMLLTHGDAMNVRTCRGYVVKRDKAIRSAWAQLVPTSPAKDIRSCWNRLLYHVDAEEKPRKAPERKKIVEDNTPKGIWGGLVGRKVVPVEDSVRNAWGDIYPDMLVPVAEEEEPAAEDEVEEVEEEPAPAAAAAAEEEVEEVDDDDDYVLPEEPIDLAAAAVAAVEEVVVEEEAVAEDPVVEEEEEEEKKKKTRGSSASSNPWRASSRSSRSPSTAPAAST